MVPLNQIRDSRGSMGLSSRTHINKMKSSCLLPFEQFVIRPSGNVSLCCYDVLGEFTLGSLKENTVLEVWNNQKYKEIRAKLYQKKYARENISICSNCDRTIL